MCHSFFGNTVGETMAFNENYHETGRPVAFHSQITVADAVNFSNIVLTVFYDIRLDFARLRLSN